MKHLDLEEVLAIHQRMLQVGGGRGGVRDFTLLHSATERPRASFGGKDLYPSIWTKAAALMQSLVKNHPFNDGNKRTAFFSTLRFLHKNHYQLTAPGPEIIKFMINVDVKKLSTDHIATWLKKHSSTPKSQQ